MKKQSLLLLLPLLLAFTTRFDVPQKPEDVSPLLVGETIPDVSVRNMAGESVSLKAEVAKKPTVLVFYRGGWCPYCNKHLAELRTIEGDLQKAGYQVVAVSTDSPESMKATMDKEHLTYTLLSDADTKAAQAFGLAYKAPQQYGPTLEKGSGGQNTEKLLPVPAVFLLDQQGRIRFEHINPNFKERISAKLLMAVANSLS